MDWPTSCRATGRRARSAGGSGCPGSTARPWSRSATAACSTSRAPFRPCAICARPAIRPPPLRGGRGRAGRRARRHPRQHAAGRPRPRQSPGCSRRSICRPSRPPASPSPISMLERVIEERARGNPDAADGDPHGGRRALVGDDLAKLKPGSPEAARAEGGADRAGRLEPVSGGRHRPGRRDLHQGAADVRGRHRHGCRAASEIDLEQSRARGRAGRRPRRPRSSARRSATTSTCATSRAARRCCCRKAKDNNASCAIGPFMRFFDATLHARRRAPDRR